LSRDKDFLKYVGQRIRIRLSEKLEGSKHFRGRLVDFLVEEDRRVIVLEVGEGKIRIPRESVWKANLEEEQGTDLQKPREGR
jgi:ribosome maturation factor RimP